MKRIEKIITILKEQAMNEEQISNLSIDSLIGLSAEEIGLMTTISRSNVSTILNQLVTDRIVVKIMGRPVRYILKECIEFYVEEKQKSEYTLTDLVLLIEKKMKKFDSIDNPFQSLIGFDGCLANAIHQAKSAVIYPPTGLNTLLLGPSGVGKTIFANYMAEFARMYYGKEKEDFPYIVFNCSDYYTNPQLLLSQLFGYAKGAFTGAIDSRDGLVERANGGILFLDEIHRLPSDGQEMLFTLIDKGEYHRLGESTTTRKARLLIIGATTEDPSVLLTTFLRRIPISITLPSLEERPIRERIDIIESIFYNESLRIEKNIMIETSVLNSLLNHTFSGNIGELKSYIKQACASSFLKQISNEGNLLISYTDLPDIIKERSIKEDIVEENILIVYNDKEKRLKLPKENIYSSLKAMTDNLKNIGKSHYEIEQSVKERVSNYIVSLKCKYDSPKLCNVNALYKIVDAHIVDFALSMIVFAQNQLDRQFSTNVLYAISLHFNFLIHRSYLKEDLGLEYVNVETVYKQEYEIASVICDKLSKEFNIEIDPSEKCLIAMFFVENDVVRPSPKIGLLLLCHGESTARSMASVCNDLLKTNLVSSLDMPLSMQIEEMYLSVVERVKSLDKGEGVILFVDMGSLCNFAERIQKEYGIKVRSMSNISTLYVLETLRRILYKEETLDEIVNAVNKYMHLPTMVHSQEQMPKAIIVCCTTGVGSARMFETKTKEILRKKGLEEIDVKAFSLHEISARSEVFINYESKYDIIACIGNIKPNITTDFFDLEEIMFDEPSERLDKYLSSFITNHKETPYTKALSLLKESTLALNCDVAIVAIRDYLEKKKIMIDHLSDKMILKCAVHLGFAIERILIQQRIIFDEPAIYYQQNIELIDELKKDIHIIEELYHFEFSLDEICFMAKLFSKREKIN